MQGIGVNTPEAAAVADATVGLLGVVHMPNGMMFFMGTKSMMFAAGWFPDNTLFSGVTNKLEGAIPNEHIRVAPLTTWIGMARPPSVGSAAGGQDLDAAVVRAVRIAAVQ